MKRKGLIIELSQVRLLKAQSTENKYHSTSTNKLKRTLKAILIYQSQAQAFPSLFEHSFLQLEDFRL